MKETLGKVVVNDVLEELKTENVRLSRELLFANKCVRLLMRFKSYLYDYCVHQSKCETDYGNRLQLRYLENEFNILVKEKNDFNLVEENDANLITAENNYEIINTKQRNASELEDEHKKDSTKKFINLNIDEKLTPIAENVINNNSQQSSKQTIKCGIDLSNNRIKRRLKCEWIECEFYASRRSKLESHMNRHLGVQPFHCSANGCDKTFYSEYSVKKHFNFVHKKQKTIRCELPDCPVMFKDKSTLRAHMRAHNTPPQLRPYACDFDGCSYRALSAHSLAVHKTSHSDRKPFTCEVCGKNFKMESTMKGHQLVHVRDPQFICDWPDCNVAYRSQISLNRHKLKHQNIDARVYHCDWPGCDYRSDRLSGVKKHKARHSDERNFPCSWPSCERRLKTKDNLIDHLKIHMNDKRHACQWPGCDYRCVHVGNLKKHFRVHCKP